MMTNRTRLSLAIGLATFALFGAHAASAQDCGALPLEGDWVTQFGPLPFSTLVANFEIAGVRIGHRCVETRHCYDDEDGLHQCVVAGVRPVYTVSVGMTSSIDVFPPVLDYSTESETDQDFGPDRVVGRVPVHGGVLSVSLNSWEPGSLDANFELWITHRSQGTRHTALVRPGPSILDIARSHIRG